MWLCLYKYLCTTCRADHIRASLSIYLSLSLPLYYLQTHSPSVYHSSKATDFVYINPKSVRYIEEIYLQDLPCDTLVLSQFQWAKRLSSPIHGGRVAPKSCTHCPPRRSLQVIILPAVGVGLPRASCWSMAMTSVVVVVLVWRCPRVCSSSPVCGMIESATVDRLSFDDGLRYSYDIYDRLDCLFLSVAWPPREARS